jgi:repressor LexA
MLAQLNHHEQLILKFIENYHHRNSRPPTMDEIVQAVGIPSKDHVSRDLSHLEDKGYIHRKPRVSRGIEILFTTEGRPYSPNTCLLPLWGTIAAGKPIPIPEENSSPLDVIEVPGCMVPDSGEVYALQVQGDSMIDALIGDGDLVLMRHQETILEGDGEMLALRLRDTDETTLKKVYHEGQRIRLQPANPTMEPFHVSPEKVQIQGKVIGVLRQME